MARFSAVVSDSSDEETESYAAQNVPKPPTRVPPKRIPEDDEVADSGSSSDEEVDTEEDDQDASGAEESEEESSSDMHEDELIPTRSKKTRNRALVEDSDGEIHEVSGRLRSHSSSSSESDFEMPVERGDASVIPWARHVGVDAQKMHVMQTSLFRMPEEAALLKSLNHPTRSRFQLLPTVNRKHSRDSEGDGLRLDPRDRASFAHDIDPLPLRPSRKYARVESSASVVAGNEGALVDAGLALGRSFRVGWGPGGTLVHLGKVCGPADQSATSANSSVVTQTTVTLCSGPQEELTSRCSRLLQHHLSKTPIVRDEDGVPFADPSSELCFSSFTALYTPTDRSYEVLLFRLGEALFDEIDLRLGQSITVDVRNRISSIRRKAALSVWLEGIVKPSVDADLKQQSSANSAALVYTLLTGHQVNKACDVAMDGGNVKLATLISQASGDFEFREDLKEQLQLWREQRIDVHIDESIRKVYALLAGLLEVVEGSKGSSLERCSDVDTLKGLDWKRAFGLHLWFSEPMDAPISQVFESYNRSTQEWSSRVASPRPWYLESPPKGLHQLPFKIPSPPPSDALFSLIRLHAEPACSLSQVLSPLSFGPSPIDYSLPWHLYIILSRCMRIRDFADRSDTGISHDVASNAEDGEDTHHEGHSPSADLLASSYAQQLEQLGMLQEAIFVLLHIEGSAGREKAIKDMLSRSADKLDEWMTSGILGSLKIPLAWVNEAKALYAVHQGEVYEAYQLYISAGLLTAAHDLAVTELAPEAVIRNDFELLSSLFEGMSSNNVQGWYFRGKAYMDYAHAMTRIPQLHAQVDQYAVPDAAQEEEVERFSRTVPRLIGLLPDILASRSNPLHQAALAEMITGLTTVLDQVRPLALAQSQVPLSGVDEATQLRHIKTSALERFMRSIQAS
ncbi:hypothetical protein BV22DRAFT_1036756 [Leucogyrophana mollusca]|uniref:Uncharacterized protein n=1 Tax=Leucogyrophana mollusca TaxID=85980 RepID=A0ACB8BBA4_9AGAM|nr:hypothetical protein BV22DRAFT_1036756 [Leucogyrophana mollusca]